MTTPMNFATENGRNTTQAKAPTNLMMGKGQKIILTPYVLPNLESNLLTVRDVINKHGPALFTKDGAYIKPTQIERILNLQSKIATLKNDQYIVTGSSIHKNKTTNIISHQKYTSHIRKKETDQYQQAIRRTLHAHPRA